jgi:hypothetical protein
VQTLTSFPASAVSRDQLSDILRDYLALDRAKIFRRLLVTRFGCLALLTAVGGAVVRGISPFAHWFTTGLLLVPPTWAWCAELRLERRLAGRLDDVDGVVGVAVPPVEPEASAAPDEKVVKSS